MVQYLSGGAWGLFARRVFEASTRNLPLMAVLFLPIALILPVLYEWARPEAATIHEIIQEKAAYLNPTVLPDPRGALLRDLGRPRVPVQSLVEGAGRQRAAAARPEGRPHARALRARASCST